MSCQCWCAAWGGLLGEGEAVGSFLAVYRLAWGSEEGVQGLSEVDVCGPNYGNG